MNQEEVDLEEEVLEFVSPDGTFRSRTIVASDGIVYQRSWGHEDIESAQRTLEQFRQVFVKKGQRYPACLDIAELKGIAPEARKIWSEFALSADSVFNRIAVHGGSFFIRTLINFYARIAKAVPMRFFASRDEAVSWLLGGNHER